MFRKIYYFYFVKCMLFYTATNARLGTCIKLCLILNESDTVKKIPNR